jgi:peptidoglycan/LPS O-acetylase OafA/YrhL
VTVTTDLTVPTRSVDPSTAVSPKRWVRRDIQGLRAVAVALVVLYHAHVPGLSGGYVGVDVFFVISGFLITGQIVREIDRTGRLSLPAFYARRMRRLLPAAITVLVTTLVVARFWGPALQLRQTAIDGLWTSFYAVNVHLAQQGVDYQQANGPQSPLQHFWSLAVEEQFYLVWPVLILAVALVARRFRRAAILVVVASAIGVSLYLSVVLTTSSAPIAYFSAQTRAWEFGFGAVVALTAHRLASVPTLVRSVATWVGLGLILWSAVAYDADTAFPGLAAVVPVAGCALVIAGGCGPLPTRSAGFVLNRAPMQGIGRISYGWYLWHWPLLLLTPTVLRQDYSWVRDVEISLLALWLAFLTYVVIERPTQRGTLEPAVWLRRGVALSAAGAIVAAGVLVAGPHVAGRGGSTAPLDLRTGGTAALAADLLTSSRDGSVPDNLTPTLETAADDVPATESGCHLSFLQVEQGACIYGDPAGTRTMVLFGDSHAQQWNGALDAAAKAQHWKLVSWTKAACPVADVSIVNPTLKRIYTECDTWRRDTVARIAALHPAVVVVSQSDSVPGRTVSNDHWAAQTLTTLQDLRQKGTTVRFLADTPYPRGDVPTCVANHLDDVRACQTPRSQAYHGSSLYTDRHSLVSAIVARAGFDVVDPVDWLCSPTTCPVIVDDTLVYRDDSHISNTYSRALAPVVAPLFAAAVAAPTK